MTEPCFMEIINICRVKLQTPVPCNRWPPEAARGHAPRRVGILSTALQGPSSHHVLLWSVCAQDGGCRGQANTPDGSRWEAERRRIIVAEE